MGLMQTNKDDNITLRLIEEKLLKMISKFFNLNLFLKQRKAHRLKNLDRHYF